MRANFDEFRDISPLFDENQRFLERNEISPNFRRIFEGAIVFRNFEIVCECSSENSNDNSRRFAKF